MNNDINLLPSQAKFQAKKMALKAKITFFLWIGGGIWVVFLIVVLGGFFVSQLVLNQVNKKYESGLAQYKSLLGSMSINQQVKYQAKIVGQILGERFEYGNSIERVKSIFSDNIKINDIEIEGKKQFILSGSIVDGRYVSEVEEIIVEINNGGIDGFSGAILKDIQIESGVWIFKMEVSLK
ncbi:MAG: hypothetical protein PHX34_01595 [Candidatus Shapirobacteria bacterium]|nr:hypothetical protein [Candidatus Shapirobacteria bacterium]